MGLTNAEFKALHTSLSGMNIKKQAEFLGLSNKTIYCQKRDALKKLIKYHTNMARKFPGFKMNSVMTMESNDFSPIENEFIHALHCGDVFFVYQPITDKNFVVKGVELLCRWRQNGILTLPGEFLTEITSNYCLTLLTAHALNDAVSNINQYPGELYFSINIPVTLLNDERFFDMALKAINLIKKPKDISRLVFEIHETTEIKVGSAVARNISKLRDVGLKFFLDDCFSQGSVFFPVRSINLDGYKLDINIISNFEGEKHDMILLKSLIHYSKLSGSVCIAEGIENIKSIELLSEIGVCYFQGFTICKPVTHDLLINFINSRVF
ncbi:Cyclic di-GMP phosphodiesterase CdpA [Klebsiella pasteurii]|nr:Cyclic di-GMP phosphodiesterase CdpA [Klebsiella pasteurii]VUS87224.1 Cyclic di-GMP phosphodiesterase CdpA [Klebsiella pasteurii]